MTKVTITTQLEGNEPAREVSARAKAAMTAAKGGASPGRQLNRLHQAATSLIDMLAEIDTLSAEQCTLLDEALSILCKKHKTAEALQVWAKMAKELERTHNKFRTAYADLNDDGAIGADNGPAGAAYRAAVAASGPEAGVIDAYRAQVAVERYARFLANEGTYAGYACNPPALAELTRRVTNMQIASRQYAYDYAPALIALAIDAAFFRRDRKAASQTSEWSAALQEVRHAEAARLQITRAQSDFEAKNPGSGDGDPEYAKLDAAWNDADSRFFRALHQLVAVHAPNAEALAYQIQAYGWLTDVTSHQIDGLTGWPMDPACPKVAAAVDEAGDDEERGLLALYRSACALAGGIQLPPLRTELQHEQLLAAE